MIENLNEFKKLYSEFYEALPEAYTEPICPFFAQIGRDYYNTQPKCLFIGKATDGWVTTSRDVDILFDNDNPERLVNRDDEIEWVENLSGNKDGYNSEKSAFWRVIKATAKNLFPQTDWYIHIAWSNIYKFSPARGNPDPRLQKIQKDICSRILDKEIESLTPDFVIFLTSEWEWFYAEHIGLKPENAKRLKWDGNEIFYQKKNLITYIQSKHPQGKKEAPHVEALTKIIKGAV